jgi:hypothetical protein
MKNPMAPKQAQQVASSRPQPLALSMKLGRTPARCMSVLQVQVQQAQAWQLLQARLQQQSRQPVPGQQALMTSRRR